MTALASDGLYEEALRGEPLRRIVRSPQVDTRPLLWLVGDWQLRVPAPTPRPVPESSWLIADIRARTGWSDRRLASALGTSHTTVGRILRGRPPVAAHSGDLLQRLRQAHEVIERVYYLAGENSDSTARALEAAPAGRLSPLEELQVGHTAKAYLAAIEVLNPRQPGLLTGDRPRRDGAIAPLHE